MYSELTSLNMADFSRLADFPTTSQLFDVSESESFCMLPEDPSGARDLILESQFQVFQGFQGQESASLSGRIPEIDAEFAQLLNRQDMNGGFQRQLATGFQDKLHLDPDFSLWLASDVERELRSFLEISQLDFAELRLRIEQPLSSEALYRIFSAHPSSEQIRILYQIVNQALKEPNLYHLDGRAFCATKTYSGQSTLILPHAEITASDYDSLYVLQTLNCDPSLKGSLARQMFEELSLLKHSDTYETLINLICRQQLNPMILKPGGKVYTAENMSCLYFLGCCSTSTDHFGSGRAVLHAKPIINASGFRAAAPRLVMLLSAPEDARSDFTDLLDG